MELLGGAVIGVAVGFPIHTGPLPFLGGMLLVLVFAYSMSWIFATVGLLIGDPETAQAAAFPVMAPLVFASSVFVPVSSMPGWLQGFATHQPVSVTASVVRALVLGGPTASYVWQSLAWAVGIVAVFGRWRCGATAARFKDDLLIPTGDPTCPTCAAVRVLARSGSGRVLRSDPGGGASSLTALGEPRHRP